MKIIAIIGLTILVYWLYNKFFKKKPDKIFFDGLNALKSGHDSYANDFIASKEKELIDYNPTIYAIFQTTMLYRTSISEGTKMEECLEFCNNWLNKLKSQNLDTLINYYYLMYLKARILTSLNENKESLEEALMIYKKVIEMDEKFGRAYLHMGINYEYLGIKDLAYKNIVVVACIYSA